MKVTEIGIRTSMVTAPRVQHTSMMAAGSPPETEVLTKLEKEISAYAMSMVIDKVNTECKTQADQFGVRADDGQTVLPFNDETN